MNGHSDDFEYLLQNTCLQFIARPFARRWFGLAYWNWCCDPNARPPARPEEDDEEIIDWHQQENAVENATLSDEGYRSADVSGASGHSAEIDAANAVPQANPQPPPFVEDDENSQREPIQLPADNPSIRAPVILNDNGEEHVPGVAVEIQWIDADVEEAVAAADPPSQLASPSPSDVDDDNPQMPASLAPPAPSPDEQPATHELGAELELNPVLDARAAQSEPTIDAYAGAEPPGLPGDYVNVSEQPPPK